LRDAGRDGAQPGLTLRQSEQQADTEIDALKQHVEQNADGQKRDLEHDHGYSPVMT
jgi:hypothetical protein